MNSQQFCVYDERLLRSVLCIVSNGDFDHFLGKEDDPSAISQCTTNSGTLNHVEMREEWNVTHEVVTSIVFILVAISHSLTVRCIPHSQFKSEIRAEVRARLLALEFRVFFCVCDDGLGVEEGRWRLGDLSWWF